MAFNQRRADFSASPFCNFFHFVASLNIYAALKGSKNIYSSEITKETKSKETSFRIGSVVFGFTVCNFFTASRYKLILQLD